jgi:hypothetical protein
MLTSAQAGAARELVDVADRGTPCQMQHARNALGARGGGRGARGGCRGAPACAPASRARGCAPPPRARARPWRARGRPWWPPGAPARPRARAPGRHRAGQGRTSRHVAQDASRMPRACSPDQPCVRLCLRRTQAPPWRAAGKRPACSASQRGHGPTHKSVTVCTVHDATVLLRSALSSACAHPDGLDVPPVHSLDQAAVKFGVQRRRPEHHLLSDCCLALRARATPQVQSTSPTSLILAHVRDTASQRPLTRSAERRVFAGSLEPASPGCAVRHKHDTVPRVSLQRARSLEPAATSTRLRCSTSLQGARQPTQITADTTARPAPG